jgi:predicted nucleic acid-binding protein
MKVLLDTNIILDMLLCRGAWLAGASAIWQASQDGRLISCITASSLTDIFYILSKASGVAAARQAVRDCLDILVVVRIDQTDLEAVWASSIPDFEDALQVVCDVREGLDAIVTRDLGGFPNAPLPVWSPTDLVARLRRPSCHKLADADLAPLRGRADYANLLWDLANTPAAAKP